MCRCRIIAIFLFILIVVNNKTWAHKPPYGQNNRPSVYYPYNAGIRSMNNKQEIICCTGTIISPSWVLTSNNCKLKNEEITSSLVTNSRNDVEDKSKAPLQIIKHWIEHPQFSVDNHSITNDVALVRLPSAFLLNPGKKVMSLASEAITNQKNILPEGCLFYSWTVTKLIKIINLRSEEWFRNISNPAEFIYKKIKVLSRKECITELNNSAVLTYGQVCGIINNNDYNDFYDEHTGGPLICNNIQFGFYTWQKEIASKGLLIIFTRVDSFHRYITRLVPQVQYVDKVELKIQEIERLGYLFPLGGQLLTGKGSRKIWDINVIIVIISTVRFSLF